MKETVLSNPTSHVVRLNAKIANKGEFNHNLAQKLQFYFVVGAVVFNFAKEKTSNRHIE